MADWDIDRDQTLLRKELHDRWGGGRFGGMEPSVKAHSVFLFTNPSKGEAFGYNYDGWQPDGTFHYTGDGQIGDQRVSDGGNKALLDAEKLGRKVRLFRSEGRETTYLGDLKLADPPYFRADAPDREGALRSVIVFRLAPIGDFTRTVADMGVPDPDSAEEVPVEASDVERYEQQHPTEPKQAVRREAKLVKQYTDWLAAHGQATVRHRVPLPGGGYLFTDVFNKATEELVEAKASAARTYIRAGLGQILDYARFVDHKAKALLVPVRPSDDLIELLNGHGCGVIWPDGSDFARVDS